MTSLREQRYNQGLCIGCGDYIDRNRFWVQLCSKCIENPPTPEQLEMNDVAQISLYNQYLRMEAARPRCECYSSTNEIRAFTCKCKNLFNIKDGCKCEV